MSALETLSSKRRILVVGCGGAGKTTFACELSEITGIPLVHLDQYYWRPGWLPTPADEWQPKVGELCAKPAWIMDGNYGGTLAQRVALCDAVVFFDLPRTICLWSVLKRNITHHGQSRPEMPAGCPERLDGQFLRWIWRFPLDSRSRILGALAASDPNPEVVTITRRTQARAILDQIRSTR